MGFTCEQCGKSFLSRTSLQRHTRAEHLGLRYLCQFCGCEFKFVGDKSKHEKHCPYRKQQKDTEGVYNCDQCNKNSPLESI